MRETKEHKCQVLVTIKAPVGFDVSIANAAIEAMERALYAQYSSDSHVSIDWTITEAVTESVAAPKTSPRKKR